MKWHKKQIEVRTTGKGLYPLTELIQACIREVKIKEGMCYLNIPHTSASLLINENYDPTVQTDIAAFLEKTIPENQPWMKHTLEGGDDSSSHLRSALLPATLTVPVDDGLLSLGTWQGVYLLEHRSRGHIRMVELRFLDTEQ